MKKITFYVLIIIYTLCLFIGILYKQHYKDQSFIKYLKNVRYTTETIDKVVYNTNFNGTGSKYIALKNGENFDFNNVEVVDNISKPYVKYKVVDSTTYDKYDQSVYNVHNDKYIKLDVTLYIPKDYFKNN